MIEDLLKKRRNISFFKQDRIPDVALIQQILEKAKELTPHKNNFWHYEIDVYGPEHSAQKKKLAMSTVCGKHKNDHNRWSNMTLEMARELETRYDDWLAYHYGDKTKQYIKDDSWHFNNQVTAPYLLAYYPATQKMRESQKQGKYWESGKLQQTFDKVEKIHKDQFNQQAGMNAMVTTMLAVEKGLDVSFCKCYFYEPAIHNDITVKPGLAFVVGIGYGDYDRFNYKSWVVKPTFDEVIKWR